VHTGAGWIDDGVVTVAAVLERGGAFAVRADEPFDEGADFALRAVLRRRPDGASILPNCGGLSNERPYRDP
jgi:hypothetical protein